MEVSGQLHELAALPPGKQPPGIHSTGVRVGPRTDLDDVEKRIKFTLPGIVSRASSR
jgi:hypothetical protein